MRRAKTWLTAAIATIALGGLCVPARADEVTLIFGTGQTPDQPVAREIYRPWVAAVNAAGKGVVQIDQRDGRVVLNTTNFYEQVSNDVVQIAFGSLDYLIGKFELTSVVYLPYEASSETASVAYWRLYKSGLLDSDFDDTIPLYVLAYPPNLLHFRKPIANPDNLRGLKIAPTSKLIAHEIQLLGGDPVPLTYQETPSALQRGMIDGFSFPMAGIYSANFGDLVPVHMNVSLGRGLAMIFMTKKKFNSLSPLAQKILLEASGETMSRKDGALYDRLTNDAVAKYKADPKYSFIQLSPGMQAKWSQDTAAIYADWVKQGAGHDKVLAKFQEILTEVKAGS